MSETGKQERDEGIAKITLPEISCDAIDTKTRKVFLFLINKELKRMSTFPRVMVEDAVMDLNNLKERVEECKFEKKSKGGPKEKTPRQSFMSSCMKKEENGGRGLDMSTCSKEWKEKKV